MAEKTLLVIVQDFCKRVGLPVPVVAAGAVDDTIVQVVGLLNEGLVDICDRYTLQQLTTYQTFTHANGPNYQALDLQADGTIYAWKFMEPLTIWDTTTKLPLRGPATMPEWTQITTMNVAPATYTYAVFGNAIHIYPVPTVPANVIFGFYYQTKAAVVVSTSPLTYSGTYDNDNATPRIPTTLVEADLKWRWKREKGLPYAEDQRSFEAMMVNLVGRTPQPILNLDPEGMKGHYGPGIFVSPGSWQV